MFYEDYLHEKSFALLGMNGTYIIFDKHIIPHRAAGDLRLDGAPLKNQRFTSPTSNSTMDGTSG